MLKHSSLAQIMMLCVQHDLVARVVQQQLILVCFVCAPSAGV